MLQAHTYTRTPGSTAQRHKHQTPGPASKSGRASVRVLRHITRHAKKHKGTVHSSGGSHENLHFRHITSSQAH
jgi:hypothetical protein